MNYKKHMKNNEYYNDIVDTDITQKTKKQNELIKQRATRRTKKPSSNMYFTLETENAIILFNKETDPIVKNKLYNEYIQYPLEKLVENIFNRFRFSYFDSHPVDVMAGGVSNILLNLDKFKEGKGKAFSYFSIVCKNYFIQINNKNHEKWKNKEILISAMPENWEVEDDFYVKERQVESFEFSSLLVDFWDTNINFIFSKKRDIQIASAIIELFRIPEKIELFNKKALFTYIREMTGCKTTHVTKVIKTMKQIVAEMSMEYKEVGDIDSIKSKYGSVFWGGHV